MSDTHQFKMVEADRWAVHLVGSDGLGRTLTASKGEMRRTGEINDDSFISASLLRFHLRFAPLATSGLA